MSMLIEVDFSEYKGTLKALINVLFKCKQCTQTEMTTTKQTERVVMLPSSSFALKLVAVQKAPTSASDNNPWTDEVFVLTIACFLIHNKKN